MLRERGRRKSGCASQRTLLDEPEAAEIFEKFEERVLAGENPDVEEHVACYRGPDLDSLRLELRLVAFLYENRKPISQLLHKQECGDQTMVEGRPG